MVYFLRYRIPFDINCLYFLGVFHKLTLFIKSFMYQTFLVYGPIKAMPETIMPIPNLNFYLTIWLNFNVPSETIELSFFKLTLPYVLSQFIDPHASTNTTQFLLGFTEYTLSFSMLPKCKYYVVFRILLDNAFKRAYFFVLRVSLKL